MNKIAVISGGLGDIGKAIAILLGKQGIKVAISDLLNENIIEHQLEEMRQLGCRELIYKQVDVTSEKEVSLWLEAVSLRWGCHRLLYLMPELWLPVY